MEPPKLPRLENPPPEPHSIYLLHFENRLHRRHHYFGITKTSRIEQRLSEHAKGQGAKTTTRLLTINDHFHHVRTISPASYQLERLIKNSGHYHRHCPICSKIRAEHPPIRYDREHDPSKAKRLANALRSFSFN